MKIQKGDAGTFKCIITFTWMFILAGGFFGALAAQPSSEMDIEPLSMPIPGSHQLRVLSPTVLELVLINTKQPDPAQITQWNFVISGTLNLPSVSEFVVTANGRPIAVQSVAFKRRPLYAPLTPWPKTVNDRDLRIHNSIFLTLAAPVADNETVEVSNPSGALWSSPMTFIDTADPLRWSPAIHVNQVGYVPGFSKKAMVGYFMGSVGELSVAPGTAFQIADAHTQAVVYQGQLTARPDVGFTVVPAPYQKILEADFTSFNIPGEYVLTVSGLGSSYPFLIHDGIAATGARAYALGLYHQRCGMDNSMPYTRHTHGPCHTAPADVPTASHPTWQFIAAVTADSASTGQTAPILKSLDTCLFPYIRQGSVDVSGGHHDAGDYSKYTVNSALMIHNLVFAADAFPGVSELDNLGIPESGDGKSDILQEAKWEADFLAKMQDSDGGFYFLVYPRARKYENNVMPDHGDPQVVWPKTTTVTASGVAALAEMASSPRFKQQFPAEAAMYLQKAQLGWTFLENAIATYGKDGCFQKITHYGISYIHNDELAWAASAMFIATGDPKYQQKLMEWLPNPNDPNVSKWTWSKLFEGYGGAIRDYAFAARTGRLQLSQLDPAYLLKCENEVKSAGQALLQRSKNCAYGSSFSSENKRYMTAGWYFSLDQAYDLATAYQVDPNPEYINALVANMNYEMGCNPVNVSFITGLGSKRQREIVSQNALNDSHVLPPSGLPLGNAMAGFQYLDKYVTSTGGNELTALTYPPDTKTGTSYALLDRWADSWNVQTEAVVINQARGLGATAYLMALTSLKTQSWNSAPAQITGIPASAPVNQPIALGVSVSGITLGGATVVWEALDQEPFLGGTFQFTPTKTTNYWVEVEVQTPDGRRSFARNTVNVGTGGTTLPVVSVAATDASASETGPDNGTFTFTRTGSTTAALTVNYSISGTATSGTDYDALSGSVTIPAGSASAMATVVPITDTLTEGAETAIVTINASAAYQIGTPNSATVSIADASATSLPTVTISASDPNASETGPDNGTFTFTRTGSTTAALTVNYSISGTATNGTDYNALSGSMTIPAGAASALVTVVPKIDTVNEGTETVVLNLAVDAAYQIGLPSSATVNIADSLAPPSLPVVSITATDASASESGDTGTVVLSRAESTASALTVGYTIGGSATYGSDYTLTGSATIPAGSSSVTVTVVPKSDTLTEGTETVVFTIVAGSGYQLGSSTSATVNIADSAAAKPTVTISASDPNASETGPDNGLFTINRNGSTSATLTVRYTVGGSATNGTDYNTLSGSVIIPVGSSSATVTVVPKIDTVNEGTETVVLNLAVDAAYQIGLPSSATVNITNGGATLPTVNVIASDPTASELGLNTGSFTVTRTGSTSASLVVRYTMGGTATNGTDYNTLSGSVTIPVGSASVNVNVVPISDAIFDPGETAVMTISPDTAYQVSSPNSDAVTIQ